MYFLTYFRIEFSSINRIKRQRILSTIEIYSTSVKYGLCVVRVCQSIFILLFWNRDIASIERRTIARQIRPNGKCNVQTDLLITSSQTRSSNSRKSFFIRFAYKFLVISREAYLLSNNKKAIEIRQYLILIEFIFLACRALQDRENDLYIFFFMGTWFSRGNRRIVSQ